MLENPKNAELSFDSEDSVNRARHRTNVRYVRGEYSPRTPIERTRTASYSPTLINEWPLIRTLT